MGLLKQFGMASPEFLAWKEYVDERVQNIGSYDETLIQNINDINKRTLPVKGTIQAGETLNLQTSLPDYIFNGNYKFFDVTCNSEYLTASFKIMSGFPYIELKNNATKSIQYELYISPVKKNICMVTVNVPSNNTKTLTESTLPDFLKGEANANSYKPICLTQTITSVMLSYEPVQGTTLEIYNPTTNDVQANILFVKKSDFYNLG